MARIEIKRLDRHTRLSISGRLDGTAAIDLWEHFLKKPPDARTIIFDLEGITYLNTAGAAVIHRMRALLLQEKSRSVLVENLTTEFQGLFDDMGRHHQMPDHIEPFQSPEQLWFDPVAVQRMQRYQR